jgi:hypothetical protein
MFDRAFFEWDGLLAHDHPSYRFISAVRRRARDGKRDIRTPRLPWHRAIIVVRRSTLRSWQSAKRPPVREGWRLYLFAPFSDSLLVPFPNALQVTES